jgi:hypothetical protein
VGVEDFSVEVNRIYSTRSFLMSRAIAAFKKAKHPESSRLTHIQIYNFVQHHNISTQT